MPSSKRNNIYKINLQEIQLKNGDPANKSLELTFDNHDDLFKIIQLVTENNLFPDKNQSIEFILGLKLMSEVILKNKNKNKDKDKDKDKDNPLFEDLKPAIVQFMGKLKKGR